MTTMDDVASRAGVSGATVSRVLSGKVHVNEATRKRVEDAIRETGYRPNKMAGFLSSGRTWTIGVTVPIREFPHFAAVLQSIVHQAALGGYAVLTGDSGTGAASQQRSINAFLERRVDGMILASNVGDNQHSGPISIPTSTPLVYMAWPTDGVHSKSSSILEMPLPGTPERWCPEEVGSQTTQLLLRRIKKADRQN